MRREDISWTAKAARETFAAAPVARLDQLCGPGPVLIIAPHPDDETLGCGGLIAMAAAAGLEIIVAVMTDGAASHPNSRAFPPLRLAQVRRGEVQDALRALAGDRAKAVLFDAPDGRLREEEGRATTWLADLGSFSAVFATWAADPHPDHQAAYRIATAVSRRWGTRLHAYPVWGLTLDDAADVGRLGACWRLDVRGVLPQKRNAIGAHGSQLGKLVPDDPDGFRLSEADLGRHLGRFEIYIEAPPGPPPPSGP